MNRGDDRLGEPIHPVEHLLALTAQRLRLGLGGQLGKFLDISAGDENVGLARDDDHGPDRSVAFELLENRFELGLDRPIQLVDRLTGQVKGDEGDSVFIGDRESSHRNDPLMSSRAERGISSFLPGRSKGSRPPWV